MTDFQDKTLTCEDCGKNFTWTASEQDFYASKGFTNSPKRCPDCRAKKKMQSNGMGGGRGYGARDNGPRQSYPITCSRCGKQDTVPFMPKGDRPVLCRDCFAAEKRAA